MKQRQAWFGAQLDLDPRKLVFIDETGASTNLARKSGRCRRGRRLRVGVAHGHYKTITLVARLRLSGLVAQKAFDKPMNAATFEDWAEKCLVPTLSKGDVVVMDNLSSHKGPRVEKLIEAAGAELRYIAALRAVFEQNESRGFPESGMFVIHDSRRGKEAAGMALSDDLRTRVVGAVFEGGFRAMRRPNGLG